MASASQIDHPGATLTAAHLIGLRDLVARRHRGERATTGLPGSFLSRRRGSGQDIADIRAYVAGDDLRHLDRGATARTGTLHVRNFQEERDRATLLVADFRPAMLWGLRRAFLSVAAAEVLALIGWQAIDAGGRVGLVAVGSGPPVMVPMRGRTQGMITVIGGLITAHEAAINAGADAADPPLDQLLDGLDRIAPTGAEIAIASGFDRPGDDFAAVLATLATRRAPHLIWVEDGGFATLPVGRYPIAFRDGRAALVRGTADRPDWPSSFPDVGPRHRIDATNDPVAMLGILEPRP